MTEAEALDILQRHLLHLGTVLEDDDGVPTDGWHHHVWKRYKGAVHHPINKTSAFPDAGVYYFIVLTLPANLIFDGIEAADPDDLSEYSSLWGVDETRLPFRPEL